MKNYHSVFSNDDIVFGDMDSDIVNTLNNTNLDDKSLTTEILKLSTILDLWLGANKYKQQKHAKKDR